MWQSFACQSVKPSYPQWGIQVAFRLLGQGMAGSNSLEHLVIEQGGIFLTNRTMIIAHHTGEPDKFVDVKPLPARVQRFEIEPVIENTRDLFDFTLR